MTFQKLLDSCSYQPPPIWAVIRLDGNCSLATCGGQQFSHPWSKHIYFLGFIEKYKVCSTEHFVTRGCQWIHKYWSQNLVERSHRPNSDCTSNFFYLVKGILHTISCPPGYVTDFVTSIQPVMQWAPHRTGDMICLIVVLHAIFDPINKLKGEINLKEKIGRRCFREYTANQASYLIYEVESFEYENCIELCCPCKTKQNRNSMN